MAKPDTPYTRTEQYLNAIAGGSGKPATPHTRTEQYLDAIAGGGPKPATPYTRLEQYLDVIADNPGGGGSSDFSTAQVTIRCSAPFSGLLACATLDNEYYQGAFFAENPEDGDVLDVILYKGKAMIITNGINSFDDYSVSGDITKNDDDYLFIVTGNGTITYNGE